MKPIPLLLPLITLLTACTAVPQTLNLADLPEPAMTQPAHTVQSQSTPEGCTLETFTIPSPSMHRDIKVAVVLPPTYATDKNARFPILYTLHGADAPYDTFAQMSPLRQSLKDHPMIVTCFDGDKRGWYIDATKKDASLFNTFFFNEFIPYIDAHYRTKADNHSRALTGFSMGGYGAFQYMLTHPEMFASVSSLSGVFDILGEHTPAIHFHPYLADLLGPYKDHENDYAKYTIYDRLEKDVASGTPLPPMFLHCGTEDGLVTQNRDFFAFLLDQNKKLNAQSKPGLVVQYQESPGKHNWQFWRDASAAVADFHWRSFQTPLPPPVPAAAPAK